jgi:uncharacterized membrane protein
MGLLVVRFVSILFAGLVAGATVCVLLVERSLPDSGSFYVLYKQRMIQALTVPLPLLAALAAVAVLVDVYGLWREPSSSRVCLGLAVGSVAFMVAGGILTKAGHFPINDQIATWDPAAPPASWSAIQAKWASLHLARTLVSTAAFALLIASNLLRASFHD